MFHLTYQTCSVLVHPDTHSSTLSWLWGPGESDPGQRDPSVPPSLFLQGSTSLKGRVFFPPEPFCMSSSWERTLLNFQQLSAR